MRTARRHDRGQGRRQAAPPAAQAGGAEDRPRPRQHAQQADPPRLDSGPTTTTDHRHQGTASARHDRQQHRGPSARPLSQPRQQDSPTARHSAHSATTADATPQRPTPSPTQPGRQQGPPRAALLLYTPITDDSQSHRPRPGHSPRTEQITDARRHTRRRVKKM